METTTQINQLVTEKEIVDVIYEAGQMPIKTLICHFRARIGSSKEAQREFMAKVRAVAKSKQYEDNKDNFRVDIGLDGEGEKEVMNYPAATRKLFFEPILTGSALEAHNALVRKQAEYQNLLPVMKMFVKQVDEDHKANKDSIRAPANATYAITINFDVRRAWIACYPTCDDAKAERNAIRTHEIDLEGWRSARVWVSTKTQETIFCIPRIDAFTPPRELPQGAREVAFQGAIGETYVYPRTAAATRIQAAVRRRRRLAMAATRIQAAARRHFVRRRLAILH